MREIFQVRKDDSTHNIWLQIGDINKEEIPNKGNVMWNLKLPYQDTYYKVEMKAHNDLGFSPESVIIIKNGRSKL